MSRAVWLLLCLLALTSPVMARTVVVVLDRSGSLRYADPQGEGPRQLAIALALGLGADDRLVLLPTRGDPAPVRDAGDPQALAGLLRDLLAEALGGGADLLTALDDARGRAGADGLVLLYTDDDLDLVQPGAIPAGVVERARAKTPRPTREALNQAARELLTERWGADGPLLVALRAPLPAQARTTPFVEALGAQVVELGAGLETAADLVTALRGDPLLTEARTLAAGASSLQLPYAARAVLTGSRPWRSPGAIALDQEGRTWLVDAEGDLQVGTSSGSVTAWIAPRVDLPPRVLGFGLREGGARIVLPDGDPGPGLVVARRGQQEVALSGSPAQATVPGEGQVTVLRALEGKAGRVYTDRRALTLVPAQVQLRVSGTAKVGEPLRLEGQMPDGYPLPARLELRARGGGGPYQALELEARDGRLVGQLFPRLPGRLEVESLGELFVRLAAPVEIAPGERHKLAFARVLHAGGAALEGQLEIGGPETTLELELSVTPPLETPTTLQLSMTGGPAEVALRAPAEVTIQDTVTVTVTLDWPVARSAVVKLKAEGEGLRASRALGVKGPASPLRRAAAIGILALSLVWFVFLLRRYRTRMAAQAAVVGDKQLRGIGSNGKISVERYFFRDYLDEDGPLDRLVLGPLEGGASLDLTLREDETVKAVGSEGSQLVHADRPDLLGREVVLRHGNAFAVVVGTTARRYVYLGGEPTADDLDQRFIEGTVSYEAELRDSGVFVVLDDDDNVPAGSDHDLTVSQELFTSHESLPLPSDAERADADASEESGEEFEDSDDETVPVVPSDADGPIVSDEGILYMDSTEAEILDSDEQLRLSNSERIVRGDEDGDPPQA